MFSQVSVCPLAGVRLWVREVCLWVQGGVHTPLDTPHTLPLDTRPLDTPHNQQAGGTHPTGMLCTCLIYHSLCGRDWLSESGLIRDLITARKRSLGQGSVFIGVCDSVNRGGVCSRGCLLPGGKSRGCLLRGVPGGDPPGRPLLRAVRILLECILVHCTSGSRIFRETLAVL